MTTLARDMNTLNETHRAPLAELLLAVADDKLLLGHRNSDWTGLGPMLEEDIAFSSLAQDEIAHAQALYEMAGTMLDERADDLAYGRSPEKYRCSAIVELPDDFDWAAAIARQFFCDHFDAVRLARLANSSWAPLAALGRRLAAEEAIHVEHVDAWVRRLGFGGSSARARLQLAVDRFTAPALTLFEPTDDESMLVTAGVYPHASPLGPGDPFDQWVAHLKPVAEAAGITLHLERPDPSTRGGRRGAHTEYLTDLLDEMCEVYRTDPGVAW